MKIRSLIVALIIISFVACDKSSDSPVFNEQITKDNLTEITAKINEDKNIEVLDISLFADGLSRLSQSDTLFKMTVGNVIESQRTFTRNQLLRKTAIHANGLEMKYAQTLVFKNFKTGTKDTNQYNILYFDIKNNSGKDINEIQGAIQFLNDQGRAIKNFPVKITDVIKAGENKSMDRIYIHSESNANDVFLRNNLKNLRLLWQPTFIQFADSTSLTTNILATE